MAAKIGRGSCAAIVVSPAPGPVSATAISVLLRNCPGACRARARSHEGVHPAARTMCRVTLRSSYFSSACSLPAMRGGGDVGEPPGSAAGARWRWRRWGGRVLEYGPLILALAATQVLSKLIWDLPNGDVDLYQNYAVAFWLHPPRLHALPVEYPPLALAVFML